jgi:hypothetical protein
MSSTPWLPIPAPVVCVEVGKSKPLSTLIDYQIRVADSGACSPRSPRTVAALALAAMFLCACVGQTTEPVDTKQRAPFYADPPDPYHYHYRQSDQAG